MRLKTLRASILCVLYCIFAVGIQAQERDYSDQFEIALDRLSAFGEAPYFSLNPGHEVTLEGRIAGAEMKLVIVPLNQEEWHRRNSSLPRIPIRRIQERLHRNGQLVTIRDYLVSRDSVTGDTFLFGEDEATSFTGSMPQFKRIWRDGERDAEAGIWQTGRYLVGSRFSQGGIRNRHQNVAENLQSGIDVETPTGSFSEAVKVRTEVITEGTKTIQIRDYASGVGPIAQDTHLKLSRLRFGSLGIPRGARFVPHSNHPYFPLAPGFKSRLEGIEDSLPTIVDTEVLGETRQLTFIQDDSEYEILTRVVEVREYVNGDLFEVGRNYYAQCVETGDVYIFGEDVEIYLEDGAVVFEGDSWMAGEEGARAGIVMPSNLTIGATYLQEFVPDSSENLAETLSLSVQVSVPAGAFIDCLQLVETSLVSPDEMPSVKIFAPGVGLVDDEGILKLTSFTLPNPAPQLSIENTVRLRWPLSAASHRLESSTDGTSWLPTDSERHRTQDFFESVLPAKSAIQLFRLVAPRPELER